MFIDIFNLNSKIVGYNELKLYLASDFIGGISKIIPLTFLK